VAAKVVIGLLAANGAVDAGQGVLDVFGKFQGGQAEHYIEATLESAAAKTVASSNLNPLPENVSGAVMPSPENIVFIGEVPSPVTRLTICTATGAEQPCRSVSADAAFTVMSGVTLGVANRAISLSTSGSLTAGGVPAILSPRNYPNTARKYLNATFVYGSGQTVTANASAFFRFKVVPCNLDGVGC